MTLSPSEPNIIALVPAYNEEKHIGDVVRQAMQYLPVMVVDDGSKDHTAAVAADAGATVIRQQPNQGKGAALVNGFRSALALGCEAIVMLDADLQHDPAEIPLFLNAYAANQTDLIIGSRDFRQMPQPRRTTNTLGTNMFSWAVGQYIPDNQSGYRLLTRRMMEATLATRETNFEFEVEMIVVCVQRGYTLGWVPIRTIYGDEKSHIRPLRHILHFTRVVLQTRRAVQKAKKQRQQSEEILHG